VFFVADMLATPAERTMAEPFTTLLTDLVDGIPGSLGAAFIDNYGETVQCFSADGDEEYIKLMGAYQGIALQTSKGVIAQLEAGSIDYYYASYENVAFLVKALEQDYFLLLALGPAANIGQGIFRVGRAAEAFNREI
jgi:predicted regulator of Ras-like GTPase activity (Roadblock/LC7/MglB family)